MKHVFIARHGLTDWNLVPKVQGMTDIPLNEGGLKQANALAENIKKSGIKFDKILYSPLVRAAETARIVAEANNIPLQEEPRLVEQNFGKWEGWECVNGDRSFHAAKQCFFDKYESGESMARLAQRIYNLLDELKNIPGDQTYLLVTHGGIARMIQSYFYDMTNEEYSSFQLENCEIREYQFTESLTFSPADKDSLAAKITEPSRAIAESLLEESAKMNPGPWQKHSMAVAKAAEKVAKAVIAAGGTSLEPEKAYVYGLLHDIGRRCGYTYMAHVIDGYEYLSAMGYENAARICITHSFNLQTTDDYIGKVDISETQLIKIKNLLDSYEYNDYDRLIQLLDSTCGADGTQNLEARMGDVKKRYGYYPQAKWNKNFELKSYFEKLMGKDFYEVIRE